MMLFSRLAQQAFTLSDMLSVILRSTHSLSPVDWASAKRSLVIAFMTRLVNSGLLVPAPVWEKHRKDVLLSPSAFLQNLDKVFESLHLIFTWVLLSVELPPLLLLLPLAFFRGELSLPVALLPQHILLFIQTHKTLSTVKNDSGGKRVTGHSDFLRYLYILELFRYRYQYRKMLLLPPKMLVLASAPVCAPVRYHVIY